MTNNQEDQVFNVENALDEVIKRVRVGAMGFKVTVELEKRIRKKLHSSFRQEVPQEAIWTSTQERTLAAAEYWGRYAAVLTLGRAITTNSVLRDPPELDVLMTDLAGEIAARLHCPEDALGGIPCSRVDFVRPSDFSPRALDQLRFLGDRQRR